MTIRPYVPTDYAEWRRMRTALWHDQTEIDMQRWLARNDATTIVAERGSVGLAGLIEAGARSFADGCGSSPVAYIEGWYVDDDVRRQGVGAALVRAAEEWARNQRFTEIGSDALLENEVSHAAHERLGFGEVCRQVQYAKRL
jgi:aminoglycoside 6'-N-acetyltransferase I